MLLGKVKLKSLPSLNMSLHIGDISQKGKGIVICENANKIYGKKCQQAFKQKKPIYLASLDTSSHIVLRSALRIHGSRSKSQQKLNLTLNLQSLIMLIGKSSNTPKRLLPHVVIVARLATTKPNVSS